MSVGKRNGSTKRQKGSSGFNSTSNNHKAYGVCSHMHNVCLIINCKHCHWQSISWAGIRLEKFNAVIPTCFCAVNVPNVLKVKDSP